ncbi:MAG TPA: Calx-beta domain-containing protein, partial [Pyrinomonadaceae bacterium]|nr:Calx-beta domain-containing protein [Pyrinomonadaceae bacterium]
MRLIRPLHSRLLLALCAFAFSVIVFSFITSPSSALTNNGSITTLESPLTENFDTLATAGTANAWSDNSTIGGLYAQFVAVGTNPTTYRASGGTDTTGAIYSFGTTAERAFGSIGSNTTGDIYYGFKLTNNTGTTITSLDVAYVGEQWRNGGNTTAQQLDFQYQVVAPGTITDANMPTSGWLDFNALDFVGPVVGSTAGALNGNDPANRVAKSDTIIVTVNAGQEIWIRWKDTNDAGTDHGLAIDDVSVTAHGGGELNISVGDATVTEGNSGTVTASFTVSLSAPAPAGGVTFDIATQDNTATTADNDYVANSLTGQTIPENATSYTFDVLVNGDTAFEPNETFFVNITNVTGANVI